MKIRITKLEINNFRGIKSASLSFTNTNFFLGNNGTGKTACLAAIARLMPILREEDRVFLDGDFFFEDETSAFPISLAYEFDLVFDDSNVENLRLEVEATRYEQGNPRSHLNDQKAGKYSVSFPNCSDPKKHLEDFAKNNLFTQRVIRNGWGGGRICPISLQQDEKQRHAATSTKEESGAFDGLRARIVQVLSNTEIGSVVCSEHPDLISNVLAFANTFLDEHRFDDIQLGHNEILNLKRQDGSIHTWDSLSGGEQSAFNLAMAIEFSIKSNAQFLILEEPETTLHPTIQRNFLSIIGNDLADRQCFISTHSPFIFDQYIDTSTLIIGKKSSSGINLENSAQNQWLFSQPSWGELSFHAYDLATFEYHNELYGWLQEKTSRCSENRMESFLLSQGIVQDKIWTRVQHGNINNNPRTIMTYIRNYTHHPENTHNQPYTETELQDSILKMYSITQSLQ